MDGFGVIIMQIEGVGGLGGFGEKGVLAAGNVV